MVGRVLRQLHESKGRSQADVAWSVEISPALLARLEANQRGLYVEAFVRIAEALRSARDRAAKSCSMTTPMST